MSEDVLIRQRQAQCPHCGTILNVPPEYTGQAARCGNCHERFQLPVIETPEDLIVDWITDEEEGAAATVSRPVPHKPIDLDHAVAAPRMISGGPLRLVQFERTSALFEFPASRLLDDDFRCTMPRRCLQCSTSHHLEAHVIIFAPQLTTSISLEAERNAGEMVLRSHQTKDVSTKDVLTRLPRVPNVPHPADRAMPYWLCDMCGSSGIIAAQIQVNSDTAEGWCRLQIGNLRRAEEFMIAAGGTATAEYAKLHDFIEHTAESRWALVPLTAQNRIQQWFDCQDGEEFVGYVPDRDLQRTEDGMSGILVSNRRLVFHTPYRHREAMQTYRLEFQLSVINNRTNLEIEAPDWQIKHFTIDRQGLTRLRRSLTLAKFKVVWK
ncbi:MAG: zinc-ribbon domain-containing protein [Planctomycetaceae bacterium]|nr:zinc-ribbon domain-containing protein [Planctomycetaceae bacterium]